MKITSVILFLKIWGLPVLMTAVLCIGQSIGFGSDLWLQETSLRLDTLRAASICWTFIVFGVAACSKSVSGIWNRLTPINDRATFIEISLVWALSATIGLSIFALVFLGVSPLNLPMLFLYCALAAVFCIPFDYALTRWLAFAAQRDAQSAKTAPGQSSASETSLSEVESIKRDINPARNEKNFWRRRLSFLLAAIAFNAATLIAICAILLVKQGSLPNMSFLTASGGFECKVVTLVTMTLFGRPVFQIGKSVLKRLGVSAVSSRLHNATAYFLGFSIVTAIVVSLTQGAIWFSGSDLMPLWSLATAYLIVSMCFVLSAIVFAWSHGGSDNDESLAFT